MELTYLHALAKRFPNTRDALVEIANLQAILTLPVPPVHVMSDVHGEYGKLRHIINNASGSLRPLLERLFAGAKSAADIGELLKLFYYPRETWSLLTASEDAAARRARLLAFVPSAVAVIRELARSYTLKHVEKIIPDPFDAILRDLIFAHELGRSPEFVAALLEPFLRDRHDLELVRLIARVVRNLSIGELVVAGDLGDRGPRLDKVIELLAQQPNVAITFGNHDASWLAASLGHGAAIATVVRVSLRYQRVTQLEEGFGISLVPLEDLARAAYGDDPAAQFHGKGDAGGRDAQLIARMQKAIAIIQFKLEGALFQKRAEWGMAHRALLHAIDPATGTIELDGKRYPLLDTKLPTIDWANPYALSAAEAACMTALTQSFVGSSTLWKLEQYVVSHGHMWLRRDRCAIFHGCVAIDASGEPLPFDLDGEPRAGKAMFEAFDVVIQRAFRHRAELDLDLVFYLWTGPRSPCFGKDRMATFETYFIADKTTHAEAKNPYFKLLDDAAFCSKILRDFGVDADHGFIINGHVPVKLEAGEQPVKKSGRAITIDGAFAAAYGDKGFSLVLDATRMYLAQHSHFPGIAAVEATGADIVPTVSDVVVYERPRTVGDTETGDELRAEVAALEALIDAFARNVVREA